MVCFYLSIVKKTFFIFSSNFNFFKKLFFLFVCKSNYEYTGLNYLHNLSPPVLHRDIKSENVKKNKKKNKKKTWKIHQTNHIIRIVFISHTQPRPSPLHAGVLSRCIAAGRRRAAKRRRRARPGSTRRASGETRRFWRISSVVHWHEESASCNER